MSATQHSQFINLPQIH